MTINPRKSFIDGLGWMESWGWGRVEALEKEVKGLLRRMVLETR